MTIGPSALAAAFLAAADAYGTPLYVTDLKTLDRHAAEAESAFPDPWLRQYSLKANGLPALVRRLARRGWGGNVVSAGEWRLAMRAGLPNAAITFEGIGKTDQELGMAGRAALDGQPLRWLSVESADELQALTRLCRELATGRRGRPAVDVLVRLNPQVEPETTAGLAVGRMSSKFGLTADEVRQLSLAGAFDDPGISLRGVHVHVGSQLAGVQAWTGGARPRSVPPGAGSPDRDTAADRPAPPGYRAGPPRCRGGGLDPRPRPARALPRRPAAGRDRRGHDRADPAGALRRQAPGSSRERPSPAGRAAGDGRRGPGVRVLRYPSGSTGCRPCGAAISSPSPAPAPTHPASPPGTTAVRVPPKCSSTPAAISSLPAPASR